MGIIASGTVHRTRPPDPGGGGAMGAGLVQGGLED